MITLLKYGIKYNLIYYNLNQGNKILAIKKVIEDCGFDLILIGF